MKRSVLTLAAAALVATGSIASAQSFRAENRVTVTPQSGDTFLVSAGGRFGARGAWCAAADYAQSRLGADGTARLFVREAAKRPGPTVAFGVGAGDTNPIPVLSVASAIRSPGSNLSVDHAYRFCHDRLLIRNR